MNISESKYKELFSAVIEHKEIETVVFNRSGLSAIRAAFSRLKQDQQLMFDTFGLGEDLTGKGFTYTIDKVSPEVVRIALVDLPSAASFEIRIPANKSAKENLF
jgi:hypothetical protein